MAKTKSAKRSHRRKRQIFPYSQYKNIRYTTLYHTILKLKTLDPKGYISVPVIEHEGQLLMHKEDALEVEELTEKLSKLRITDPRDCHDLVRRFQSLKLSDNFHRLSTNRVKQRISYRRKEKNSECLDTQASSEKRQATPEQATWDLDF